MVQVMKTNQELVITPDRLAIFSGASGDGKKQDPRDLVRPTRCLGDLESLRKHDRWMIRIREGRDE
jgi:hypothetical protein